MSEGVSWGTCSRQHSKRLTPRIHPEAPHTRIHPVAEKIHVERTIGWCLHTLDLSPVFHTTLIDVTPTLTLCLLQHFHHRLSLPKWSRSKIMLDKLESPKTCKKNKKHKKHTWKAMGKSMEKTYFQSHLSDLIHRTWLASSARGGIPSFARSATWASYAALKACVQNVGVAQSATLGKSLKETVQIQTVLVVSSSYLPLAEWPKKLEPVWPVR